MAAAMNHAAERAPKSTSDSSENRMSRKPANSGSIPAPGSRPTKAPVRIRTTARAGRVNPIQSRQVTGARTSRSAIAVMCRRSANIATAVIAVVKAKTGSPVNCQLRKAKLIMKVATRATSSALSA